MTPKRAEIKWLNAQAVLEYYRLQARLRAEPEPWPFPLTKDDEAFLKINRIAK